MKKILNGVVNYNGKPGRIQATITDVNGYISITGEIKPYRCKTVHACGCLHDEIYKAFPALRPFLWLHLVNLDGSVPFEVENSLFYLANNENEKALNMLHCTPAELSELSALVTFGLHHQKLSWGMYYTVSEDGQKVYARTLAKLNLQSRRLNAIKDFYGVLNSL